MSHVTFLFAEGHPEPLLFPAERGFWVTAGSRQLPPGTSLSRPEGPRQVRQQLRSGDTFGVDEPEIEPHFAALQLGDPQSAYSTFLSPSPLAIKWVPSPRLRKCGDGPGKVCPVFVQNPCLVSPDQTEGPGSDSPIHTCSMAISGPSASCPDALLPTCLPTSSLWGQPFDGQP